MSFRFLSGLLRRGCPSRAVEMAERAMVRIEDKRRQLCNEERRLLSLERELLSLSTKTARTLDRAKAIAVATAEDIRESRRALDQAEKAMEALRTAHEIDAEVALPAVFDRLREYESASKANIALHNRRRGSVSSIPNEEE